jgi:hypothetical protein
MSKTGSNFQPNASYLCSISSCQHVHRAPRPQKILLQFLVRVVRRLQRVAALRVTDCGLHAVAVQNDVLVVAVLTDAGGGVTGSL